WRILIPDYLKEYADLTRDIKILGVADRIEIWDIGKWEKFYGASREKYEEIAENLMDLE
ncbi:MAG: cell division/cell wall cluster transcriptional repressor MraZ, partial [Candidatus Omnitrophica bacterium]|nr:cell division/cell wall cluster transcriptional repressor MraZ [Candidatus Omnitrophota bacterium]